MNARIVQQRIEWFLYASKKRLKIKIKIKKKFKKKYMNVYRKKNNTIVKKCLYIYKKKKEYSCLRPIRLLNIAIFKIM